MLKPIAENISQDPVTAFQLPKKQACSRPSHSCRDHNAACRKHGHLSAAPPALPAAPRAAQARVSRTSQRQPPRAGSPLGGAHPDPVTGLRSRSRLPAPPIALLQAALTTPGSFSVPGSGWRCCRGTGQPPPHPSPLTNAGAAAEP